MGRRGAAPAAEEGTADLVSVGQMLSKPKFDRDAALEGLERAAACLRRAAQGDARVQKASVGLERALISKHVLEHCDKGVRTRAALCVALTLKLHAPDCPYTDAELETAFDLVASTFSALEDASRPLYGESLAVLHLLDTLKMPLLLLDLETPDAAVSLARTLLDSITDASGAEVLERAGRVLAALADEGADFAGLPALLETLLVHLVPPRRTESPQAAEVVRDVLARCEATLGPPTAALLTGVVARAPSARGVAPELRSHVTELLLELHATSQPILLPIVAALKPELTSEAEDARRGAVALVGRLLASGGGEMAAAYPDLLEAWARRGVDRSAAVRLAVLEQGRAALCGEQAALGEAGRAGKGASGSACAELRAAAWRVARDRVLDGDEGVRALAVRTVCDAAAGGAQGGEADDALRAVAERLRDVRPGVQGEAARGLLRVYRARGCAAVAWVPGAVAASAVRVAEVRAALEAEPLFPAAVPAEAVARRWVEVWQASGAVERSALARLLRVRTRVCGDMARLLEARRAVREAAGSGRGTKAATLAAGADAGDVARRRAAEAEVAALAQRVAAGLPVGEAAALVRVLSTHLDRKLFMALGRFCDPDLTAAAARDATTETIQRWSAAGRSDAAARAALTGLCRRMSPVLLAAPHVEALVALAAQEDGEATCGALVEVASALPDAVAARRALLVPLLAESAGRPRSAALATAACQALANAMRGRTATARRADAEQQADGDDEGGSDRSAPDTDDPGRRDGDICDLLGALCGGSDARVVKHACRALASFAAAEAHRGPDQPPLSGRAEETLGEVLRDAAAHVSCCRDPAHDARVPASYAAIGAGARLRPDLYEDVAQEVGDAVLGGGLWRHADRRQRAPGSAEDAAGPSRPASALAAGLRR
ncbi:unnamed protein product [Pedinophyceae sp. YPF-701]|nr:unnamed protein product [Pedinophyceae sp. YPF-701]